MLVKCLTKNHYIYIGLIPTPKILRIFSRNGIIAKTVVHNYENPNIMNKIFFLILTLCGLFSCDKNDERNLKMLELQSVNKAFNRVELIYNQKNPLLRKFLNSAKKDKSNLYTSDMDEILNLTNNLNDSIEKGIDELDKLREKIPNSYLIKTTTEYFRTVNDLESDMTEFLKLVTDSIENNHLEITEKIGEGINKVLRKRSDYQNELNRFYSENKFTRHEIDSLIGRPNR